MLDKIIRDKMREVDKKKRSNPISASDILERKTIKNFSNAIKKQNMPIIAEIKRKSPSAGIIKKDFNHIKIAKTYEKGGACAISILTDNKYFGGKLSFISDIKDRVNIPVLRKEFIIDEYQVYESTFSGADAMLLIVKALSFKKLKQLISLAKRLGIETLVEVHSKNELDIAIDAGANIIGVNNRNLDTMTVDITTSLKLVKEIPTNCIKISESGIRSYRDIKLLKQEGFNAFLIGESLMNEKDPGWKLKTLIGGE